MTSTKFVPPQIAEKIKETAVLEDVIHDFISLKKSGTSLIGACPCCGAKKKLTVTPSKKIWKCFVCDEGGKDAISFLIKTQGKAYPEALLYLADRYQIVIDEQPPAKRKNGVSKQSFRNGQLLASGIPTASQKYYLSENDKTNTKYQLDRYQAATIDKYFNILPGDDMVLHYLGLDGKPLQYLDQRGKKKTLIRVRWANPSLHKDKDGHPVKYKSPYKSGSHLWLPNTLIKAYQGGEAIDTLYICEGEKKAEKMSLHGMYAVGIMGIHNFAYANSEMPYQFELLIKRCNISSIVFLLDSDWQDISIKPGKAVDQRPRTFFSAVQKFKRYFEAYRNNGIYLQLYLAHGKHKVEKGIDDVLVRQLKKKEKELVADFEKAKLDRAGEGAYINMYNITTIGDYKLQEYWDLHSPTAFLSRHKAALQKVEEFIFRGIKRRVTEEGEFELAQALLPSEQYWEYEEREKSRKLSFKFIRFYIFLRNRGYGIYKVNDTIRFIHLNGKVISEVTPHDVQRFVQNFTEEIGESEVLEMLYRAGPQYLGQAKLENMKFIKPDFILPAKKAQFLYFKNCYWKITADEVVQRPLSDLPGHIWKDQIIDFDPKYIGRPICDVKKEKGGQLKVVTSAKMKSCNMAAFYANTSNFHWRKQQELQDDGGGDSFYTSSEEAIPATAEEHAAFEANLVCKMIAAGYILHEYKNYAEMKAIIAMDGMESEVGRSQGGTGKSLWATQFKHLIPTEILDGKQKNITDDAHLYDSVDERTKLIIFDDCRVNLDIENFFSQITQSLTVNPKGERKYKIEPPKFVFSTNHAVNGEDNSSRRRQYYLSFSDYYNEHRTVAQDFGCQFFHEWDWEQWNLFYNWMANCLQTYFRLGLNYTIPLASLERRKLRQRIGENFLEWASLMYDADYGYYLNHKVEKVFACNQYLEKYPQERKYVNPRKFKEKIQLYGEYSGLEFNPDTKGERLKSNGKEYLILANESYDINKAKTINNQYLFSNQNSKL